jgi:predicted ATPase
MKKLSPHYRNDGIDGIDPTLVEHLDEVYFKKLDNLDVPNPRILVVFSGGNAVGKSTISREIRKRFKALVIENDAIKQLIFDHMPNLDRATLNKLTWQYTMNLYPRLGQLTQNGLVVRDGVIDWYYDRIIPEFKDYDLFIVGFDLSRSEAKQLIDKRGDTALLTKDRLHTILDDHLTHIKRFREEYTPDVMLTKDTLFDYHRVIDALSRKLQTSHPD